KARPKVRVLLTTAEGEETIEASHFLVAAGRQPNIDALDLKAGRIKTKAGVIRLNARLRTSNRRVYAIGDVTGAQYAHMANYHAGVVVRNMLFHERVLADASAVPRVVFTDPELAHVGLTEDEARRSGQALRVLRWPYLENARAQAERKTIGHIKVLIDPQG